MSKGENPNIIAATEMGATSAPDTTGDEPMTEKQAAELRQLCEDKGKAFDASLTSAQAAERIKAVKA